MDQAKRLRDLVKQRGVSPQVELSKSSMRIISVTSGKGGVGKTNFALNLAIHLSKAGQRVIIVDADFGFANVEVLLGLSPRYSFKEVLSGQVSVADALTKGPAGLRFISGGSGLTQMSDVSDGQMGILLSGFQQLAELADILIIDTGAGMSKAVTNFLKSSHEIIVVTTSDPTAIADAYSVMKAIAEGNENPPTIKIVINRVENFKEGQDVYSRLYRVCTRFLKLKPEHLGSIPYDKFLVRSVKSQEPVAILYPNSESSRCIEAISKRLLHNAAPPDESGLKQFLNRWVGFMKSQ